MEQDLIHVRKELSLTKGKLTSAVEAESQAKSMFDAMQTRHDGFDVV